MTCDTFFNVFELRDIHVHVRLFVTCMLYRSGCKKENLSTEMILICH